MQNIIYIIYIHVAVLEWTSKKIINLNKTILQVLLYRTWFENISLIKTIKLYSPLNSLKIN